MEMYNMHDCMTINIHLCISVHVPFLIVIKLIRIEDISNLGATEDLTALIIKLAI